MKFITESALQASSAEAWAVLAERFGEVGAILSTLESSELKGELKVGGSRVCVTKPVWPFGSTALVETLTKHDPKTLTFSYKVTQGLPGAIQSANSDWNIESLTDDKSKIRSVSELQLKWWVAPFSCIIRAIIKKEIAKAFEEFTYYLENKKVHPRAAD